MPEILMAIKKEFSFLHKTFSQQNDKTIFVFIQKWLLLFSKIDIGKFWSAIELQIGSGYTMD